MRWLTRLALRVVPRDWRAAVADDFDHDRVRHSELGTAGHAMRIGLRLRTARLADRCRTVPSGEFLMRDLTRDIRFALRGLRRHPGYAAAVIATLAIGIGANTAIFSIFNWILFRPLPGVTDPQDVVTLRYQTATRDGNYFVSYRDYAELRDGLTASFSGLAASAVRTMDLSTGTDTRRVDSEVVTHNYFSVLGVRVPLGRAFTRDEEHPGGPASVIISRTLWRDAYASDPNALGRTLLLNGRPFTIVGVTEEGFQGRSRVTATQVWMSMAAHARLQPPTAAPHLLTSRRNAMFGDAFGRLRVNTTIERAQAEAHALMAHLPDFANRTPTPGTRSGLIPVVYPGIGLDGTTHDRLTTVFRLLMGGVGLLLVLGCANAANLLLARATGRRREIAVCQAIGASRFRIIRQQLVEGFVLALAAGIAGLGLAAWLTWLFDGMRLVNFLPAIEGVRIDWRVCAFAVTSSLFTGIGFATAPAIAGSRVNLHDSLKDGITLSRGARRRMRGVLVVAQVTVSVLLLVAAGLFVRTLQNLRNIDLGLQRNGLVSFGIDPSRFGLNATRSEAYIRALLERLRATPGIEHASYTWTTSFSSSRGNLLFVRPDASGQQHLATQTMVSPGYFATMGIPIVAGRDFTDADVTADTNARGVVILSQRLAAQIFPNGTALGAELALPGWSPARKIVEVVGIAGDVRGRAVTREPERWAYLPATEPTWGTIQVRATLPPAQTIAAIRDVAKAIDPVVAPHDIETFGAAVDRALSEQRLFARMSSVFGVVAALLAGLGIYSMMAGAVSDRRKEFGIRLALGASAASVLALVLRSAALLGLAGTVAGLAGAAALRKVVEARLYGVTAVDPTTLAGAALAVMTLSIVASLLPAVRAARVDAVRSLRVE